MSDDVLDFEDEKEKRTIYRVIKDKDNPYVQINKTVLNDDRLSWKAKGLHVYMLSMPDNWVFHREELINHSSDKLASLKSAIAELELFGYLEITHERIGGKFASWHTNVYETPKLNPNLEKHTRSRISTSGENSSYVTRSRKTTSGKSTTTNNNNTNNDLDLNKTTIPRSPARGASVDNLSHEFISKQDFDALVKRFGEGRVIEIIDYAKKRPETINKPLPYVRKLLEMKASLSKDLGPSSPYPTVDETSKIIKPSKVSEKMPENFVTLVRNARSLTKKETK